MADQKFIPPPPESHQGPAPGFTPPPPVEDQPAKPGLIDQAKQFASDHPYITAASTLLPGVGPIVGAFADRRGDVGKGALKQVGRDAYGAVTGPVAGPLGSALGYVGEKTGLNKKVQALTEPNNPAQEVGGWGTTAAELAAPAGKLLDMIPSASRAGKGFEYVMSKAKDVPVDTSRFAQPLLRAQQLNARTGDVLPAVARKALGAIGPTTEPLTYGVSRDLAGAAGRKALTMSMRPQVMSGPMGAQMSGLAEGLDAANEGAARSVGVGDEYRDAMNEYRRAMALRQAGKNIVKFAPKAALYGVGAGAGYKAGKALGVIP